MSATATKKITAATFKAFIRKNAGNLHIATHSRFDCMVDVSVAGSGKFTPALATGEQVGPFTTPNFEARTCGIRGVWLVGSSRDYFEAYNKDGFSGIEVSNSCGCFVVAIQTTPPAPLPPVNVQLAAADCDYLRSHVLDMSNDTCQKLEDAERMSPPNPDRVAMLKERWNKQERILAALKAAV